MARPRVRAPSLREYERIVKYLKNKASRRPLIDYVLPLFLAVTGARVSEALEVNTYDIDFDNGYVAVPTKKSGRGRKRIIPLPSWFLLILQRYIIWNGIGDRLFPISRIQAWRITKKETGWNPHALRHSFGMYLLYNGWDVEQVRRVLGHSSWDMVKYYVESVGIEKEKPNPLDYL